ncbi:MAG TPA: hypothetical protein VFS00_20275, partial [Polyangiaceae bacterium]|nr:hypothetical protein [Polyangiaceae bacterium]
MKRARLARAAGPALALAVALASPAACDSGVPASSGVEGPLRVAGGQHLPGALPGSPPVEAGAEGAAPAGPGVTLVEATSRLIAPGEGGKGFSGRTTPDARALALAFADLDAGHWLVPVGGPDPAAGGELTWQVNCDFGQDIPPGPHTLRFVAVDERGVAGAARDLSVCVSAGTPGDLSACDPAAEPPAAVLSLEWDRNADLDLEV